MTTFFDATIVYVPSETCPTCGGVMVQTVSRPRGEEEKYLTCTKCGYTVPVLWFETLKRGFTDASKPSQDRDVDG